MEKLSSLKNLEITSMDNLLARQEKEHQRIAEKLHDGIGNLLFTLKVLVLCSKASRRNISMEEAESLKKIDDLTEEISQEVRELSHDINNGIHIKESLSPTVKDFAAKVSTVCKVAIEVVDHGIEKAIKNEAEIRIFSIIQELINNTIYAEATKVAIRLANYGDNINIAIEDNGIGFGVAKTASNESIGPHFIKKRIEQMGGQINIDSTPRKGTKINIKIPVQ